jgi:hypothetical protein
VTTLIDAWGPEEEGFQRQSKPYLLY